MSDYTHRVFLPDGSKIYVSDDNAGDQRLAEIYERYGNVQVEICRKEFGKVLDEQKAMCKGPITSVMNGLDDDIVWYDERAGDEGAVA